MRLDPKVATWLPPSLVTGWTESWNLRTHLWKSLPGSWRWLQGQEADGHDREVNRAQGLSLILSFPSVTEVRAGSQQKYILKSLIPSLSLRPAQRSDWGTRERVTEEWAQRTEGTSGAVHMPSFFEWSERSEESGLDGMWYAPLYDRTEPKVRGVSREVRVSEVKRERVIWRLLTMPVWPLRIHSSLTSLLPRDRCANVWD